MKTRCLATIPGMLLLLFVVGCKKDSGGTSSGGGGAYAGNWTLTHTPTSIGNSACEMGSVGTPQSEGPLTVDSSGNFTFTAGGGSGSVISGSVQSNGSWSATLSAVGSCSSPGTASGTCSSTTACSGTYSFSGNTGTISLTR